MSSNLMPGSEGMPGGDDDEDLSCPDCDDGEVPDNGTNNGVCETCNGKGFIERDYDESELFDY